MVKTVNNSSLLMDIAVMNSFKKHNSIKAGFSSQAVEQSGVERSRLVFDSKDCEGLATQELRCAPISVADVG